MRRLGFIIMSFVVFLPFTSGSSKKVADLPEIHHTDHLVMICMDFRIHDRVHVWIKETLGQADLIAAAGAARLFDDEAARRFLLEQVRLAVELHGMTNLHLIDHLDCCAYRGSASFLSMEKEIAVHQEQFRAAAAIIRRSFPCVRVRLYILGATQPQCVDE